MLKKDAKILICDDSILARKNLSAYLDDFGYSNIYEAANGQDAVDMCAKINPDVVFLDIVMPIKDGVTATKEIIEANRNINVIIISSVGTQNHITEAIKAGARDFIQKPIDEDVLKQTLENING